ncbi:MAG: tRNA threonylcarbamoyladenosine dehydratase [Treponema sp.]|nr:tRNA threonylcarbamoyladenosine dehydratase [Treponema sp.]
MQYDDNRIFHRLSLLVGPDALKALWESRVMLIGLGGVGSWCAEALVRSGIGNITIVDYDTVCLSNTNRQIQALNDTIGRLKAEVLAERLKCISPECNIIPITETFSKHNTEKFNIDDADYIIDAIDSLESKLDLIETAFSHGKRLFSSMGMAFKLDPTQIKVQDIWNCSGCPLARLVRHGLRKRGFTGTFPVVYSPEVLPKKDLPDEEPDYTERGTGRRPLGSAMPVTAAAGMTLASLVIRDIVGTYNNE